MFDSRKLLLLVVISGTALAGAQSAPGTNRAPAAVTAVQPASPATEHAAKPKLVPAGLKYWLFIAVKADDHASIQKEILANPNRFPQDIELQDMSMHIGIRPDEYAIILTHILDANRRLTQNETEWSMALSSFQSSPGYSAKSVPPPGLIALSKEHDAIINETIRSLKHELGDSSFNKLDTWVDLNYVAETSGAAPRTRPTGPSKRFTPPEGQAPAILT
jgi:hypothetical protein